MDKILRINMGASGGPSQSIEEAGEFSALGGRATTSTIVAKEVPPDCHPLGAENKLVIAPGMLSGTAAAMSGRISVGCKSPLTGGIKESNAGGQPSQVMARLGYAAIIIEGKPTTDDLYKIHIDKDKVTISVDNSLKLMDNYPLIEKLRKEYGDKAAYMSIGSAGERKMAAASIACTDPELRPSRHCGRGGVGAVMGAKQVKAIIFDDSGCAQRQPKDPEQYKAANRAYVEGIRKHAVSGEGLPAYGTNILTNVINEAGGYPTRNFKTGFFEGGTNISGETQAELEVKRGGLATQGCHRGCVIQCSGVFNDKDGKYLTKQPEYETVWSHGGHCGIDDLDTIAMLDYLDDNIGVDTIEMGVAIGVAMDGGVIEFGDCEGAIRLVRDEVGKGTP
ncbi:MAG TPA: aldehyde ferredoxin oxidoreductase N-terminal domain-containing protein, partial [Pelovirga sp.]|nr:aldehyde ferredoxin oxidoreductase N-terminal domain-containing protein [Pelovirga sp.]